MPRNTRWNSLREIPKNTMNIRAIEPGDIQGVEQLIKTVMPEFGACGEGFSINDPEVLDMFSAYNKPGHVYFVISDGKKILGGGGIAPLTGEDKTICELRKMYFLKEIRGQGLGQKLMESCLKEARSLGYKQCYLETLKNMDAAKRLYEKNGFHKLKGPMGNTGHFGCDSFYLKKF